MLTADDQSSEKGRFCPYSGVSKQYLFPSHKWLAKQNLSPWTYTRGKPIRFWDRFCDQIRWYNICWHLLIVFASKIQVFQITLCPYIKKKGGALYREGGEGYVSKCPVQAWGLGTLKTNKKRKTEDCFLHFLSPYHTFQSNPMMVYPARRSMILRVDASD